MAHILQLNYVPLQRQKVSIFMVWLFHLSAIIGISIGFEDWFMAKTPINLSIIFALLFWSFADKAKQFWTGMAVFFAGGMILEWVGVQYGFLFGEYVYGNNLGPKISGVPWFIGINWAVLTIITGVIASKAVQSKIARVFFGTGLMLILDFFLELSAPVFDFWIFDGGVAPLQNYVAWVMISVLFHFIFQSLSLKGDSKLAWHLYGAQLLFFVYFFFFYQL